MRRLTKVAVALLFSFVLGGTALAGFKVSSPVYVNVAGRYANGMLGSARNSADALQYIGCYSYVVGTNPVNAVCYARDSAGNYVTCRTTVPGLVQVAQSLNSDSHLWFGANADGTCNEIDAYTISQSPPKNP